MRTGLSGAKGIGSPGARVAGIVNCQKLMLGIEHRFLANAVYVLIHLSSPGDTSKQIIIVTLISKI